MDDGVLGERDHLLIGFEGPICALHGDGGAREVADRLKHLLHPRLPRAVQASGDPFDVLRYAAVCGSATAEVVGRQLNRLEVIAVTTTAVERPGATDNLRRLRSAGYTVTLVSNVSTEAIRSFLLFRDLRDQIRRVSARVSTDPALLIPDPYLVSRSVHALGASPEHCVMIAASVDDAQAAQSAGVSVIACGTTPSDHRRLRNLGVEVFVEDLAELR